MAKAKSTHHLLLIYTIIVFNVCFSFLNSRESIQIFVNLGYTVVAQQISVENNQTLKSEEILYLEIWPTGIIKVIFK